MFGYMKVTDHEAALATRDLEHAAKINGILRDITTERSITASLRAEIAEMKPLYDLGVRAKTQRDKDTAAKKAKRAEKTVASVPAGKSKRAAK